VISFDSSLQPGESCRTKEKEEQYAFKDFFRNCNSYVVGVVGMDHGSRAGATTECRRRITEVSGNLGDDLRGNGWEEGA
jgi:hypothetical protein